MPIFKENFVGKMARNGCAVWPIVVARSLKCARVYEN
jgi:hypothetical protein